MEHRAQSQGGSVEDILLLALLRNCRAHKLQDQSSLGARSLHNYRNHNLQVIEIVCGVHSESISIKFPSIPIPVRILASI